MFEVLEHTADIGLRARGATAEEMFAAAAEGLVSLILERDEIQPLLTASIEATGEDLESLLVAFLSEVLYLVDARRFAVREVAVESFGALSLRAVASGETRDPARHRGKLIVKGVTWHQLRVVPGPPEWLAEVFLDI